RTSNRYCIAPTNTRTKGGCRKPCYGRGPSPAQIHTLTSGMPGCRAPSSRPEPALLGAAAAVLPDQVRAADGPSSKPNPGHGGHSQDNAAIDRKRPQKEATRT